MYHPQSVDSTIRIFSPVVLFHDVPTECSDTHVIQLKKQKISAMLKTNGQFWSHVISSTRNHQYSPPQTPTFTPSSSNSSVISYDEKQKWYNTPCKTDEESEGEDDVEIEDDPIQSLAAAAMVDGRRKRRGNLPKSVTIILRQWLVEHALHPYPTEEEKKHLKSKTSLTMNQISNWFINARRRILPLILSTPSPSCEKKKKVTTNKRKRSELTDVNKQAKQFKTNL